MKRTSSLVGMIIGFVLAISSLLQARTEKIKVFVSILPQKFFVEQIGKDKVAVSVLVRPGQCPETYEPLPQQMAALADTKVYFRIGAPFEMSWIKKIAQMNPHMQVVDTREGIPLREMDALPQLKFTTETEGKEGYPHVSEDEHHHHYESGMKDPHIWLSPQLVKRQAETISDQLIALDPENAIFYKENLRQFQESLDDVSVKIKTEFNRLSTKTMLVFHPAWGYFADEFGLTQVPVEMEGKEPSPGELVKLIDFARNNNVTAIFVQKQFATKTAESVAQNIGAVVVIVDPLAENYLENLISVARTIADHLDGK